MIAGLMGLAVAAVGIAVAWVVYFFSHFSGIALLLALFSVWIPMAACSDAQLAVLVRDGRLSAAAACEIIGEIAGAGVGIVMLHNGFGAPALVYGRIAAQGIQLLGALVLSKILPTFAVRRFVFDELFEFSKHILSVRILANLRMSIATFVIAGSLGAASVGFFRVAQRLTGSLHELLSEPVRSVAWVIFRRVAESHGNLKSQEATANFQRTMEWIIPLLLGIMAPIYLGVAIMSEELLVVLLGEAWRPAAPLVSILALGMLLLTPSALTEPLLGITGNMRFLALVSLLNTIVALALIVPAAQFDVEMVAWAQLVFGFIGFGTTIWLHEWVLGFDWWQIGRKSVFLLPVLLVMSALALVVRDEGATHGVAPLASLIVTALSAAILYFAGIALLRAKALPQLLRSLRRA